MKNILSGVLVAVVAMGGIGMSHASTSHQTREMPQEKFVEEHGDDYQTVAPYRFAGILMGLLQEVKGSPQTWKLPSDFFENVVFFSSEGKPQTWEAVFNFVNISQDPKTGEITLTAKKKNKIKTSLDFVDTFVSKRTSGANYIKKGYLNQLNQH